MKYTIKYGYLYQDGSFYLEYLDNLKSAEKYLRNQGYHKEIQPDGSILYLCDTDSIGQDKQSWAIILPLTKLKP